MKPPIAVSLIICGTLLLVFPFIYYLTYSSQQAYVLANRTDTRPAAGMLNYNPSIGRSGVQTGIGVLGLVMIVAGAVGGSMDWPGNRIRQAKIPIDVNVTAYAPEEE